MPRVEFRRIDLALQVVPVSPSSSQIRFQARVGGKIWERSIPLAELNVESVFPIPAALHAWKELGTVARPASVALHRVTVETRNPGMLVFPWELAFDLGVPVVRVTPVQPHSGIDPFKLPLRIVQIGRFQTPVPQLVDTLLGRGKSNPFPKAIRTDALESPAEMEGGGTKLGPTTDVIHFAPDVEFARANLLSFADTSALGTAAWLSRLCMRRQTRLVVFCRSARERPDFMRLASALVESGGPAVLVESLQPQLRQKFYESIYSDLIHDFPLDSMLQRSMAGFDRSEWGHVSLFAGAGREDELRVSTIGIKALRIRRFRARSSVFFSGVPSQKNAQIQQVLGNLRKDWNTVAFEFHKGEGLLPLSEKVHQIRSILSTVSRPIPSPQGMEGKKKFAGARPIGRRRAGPYSQPEGEMAPSGKRPRRTRGEPPLARIATKVKDPPQARPVQIPSPPQRFLNIGFWQNSANGRPKKIRQKSASLRAGEIYQLGIDIGPKSFSIQVYDLASIEEERFRWTPKMKGTWIEIAVTGIDFEVVGNPVREVWLPRQGATERIFFPVIAKGLLGISRLRVCLYRNQDVIQTFRTAAVTVSSGPEAPAIQPESLATALNLPVALCKQVGYLSRLEYSTNSIQNVANQSAASTRRTLSIVVNDWDNDTVITVKGPGLYAVQILADSDVPQHVQDIRDRLQAASTFTFKDESRGYAFGTAGQPNGGTPKKLAEVLTSLAVPGWRLFDKLVLEEQRAELERYLSAGDVTIHVAHVIRNKVIPWAILYDRAYDTNKRRDADGRPVGFGVCTACLPDENGSHVVRECFTSPNCLLHGYPNSQSTDASGKTLLPETVVCPLHFWGFRHVIEVPPQQVPPDGKRITMPIEIPVEGKAHLIAGVNTTLSFYDQHLKYLAGLANRFPATWAGPEGDRDKILELLKDLDLSVIYFYCHAAGGMGSKLKDPELQFQKLDETQPGIITPDGLSYRLKWRCNPLVFLNGCGTAGYTPEALSPFIKKLVDDRGAAGVIGTEVPVWEQLASEFAGRFFEMFLNQTAAGIALLLARRQLLAQNNPLGLAYTLFAAADLKLNFQNQLKV